MSLFPLCELCHFLTSDSMKVYRQWVPCKRNCLYNFIPIFMQLCTSFFQSLKMCIWFGFYHAVIFCHFSILLTLSLFNFSQVRHQLHRSLIYIYFCVFPFPSAFVWICTFRRHKTNIMIRAPSEDWDQSLRCLHEESLVLSYPFCTQRRLWQDWADA